MVDLLTVCSVGCLGDLLIESLTDCLFNLLFDGLLPCLGICLIARIGGLFACLVVMV